MSATPIAMPAPDDLVSDDSAPALERISMFSGLPNAVMATLEDATDIRSCIVGQTIYALGQFDGAELFIVLSGRVRVSVLDAQTGAMFIEELQTNDFFGIEAALRDDAGDFASGISVTAEEDTRLAVIDAAIFRQLAGQRPSLMRNIAMHFATEIATLRYKATNAEAAPEQRVYAALIEITKREGINGQWRIEHMPKHREIAEKTGVEETDVANSVAILIQENIAERDYPGLIINDMARFNALAK